MMLVLSLTMSNHFHHQLPLCLNYTPLELSLELSLQMLTPVYDIRCLGIIYHLSETTTTTFVPNPLVNLLSTHLLVSSRLSG